MAGKFVMYLDKTNKYRFRLLAANNEIIASGESYESKTACLKGIKSIQKNAVTAEVVDQTTKEAAAKKPAAKKTAVKKTTAKKTTTKKTTVKKPAVKKAASGK